MPQMSPTEDIRSVTDLERNTRDIFAKLLALAELDLESGRTRPAREFLKVFRRVKIIVGFSNPQY